MKRGEVVALVCGLTVFGALLRVHGLDGWLFSGDEAEHLLLGSHESWAAVIRSTYITDTHPPLFYLAIHALLRAFGTLSPMVARSISLVAGLAVIGLFYRLGRRVGGAAGGLALAALATVSAQFVLQSQTMRHYALLLVCLAGMLAAFLEPAPSRRSRAQYAVCATLAVFCHYAAFVIVAATGCVSFVATIRRSRGGLRGRARAALPCVLFHAAIAVAVAMQVRVLAHGQEISGKEVPEYMTNALVHSLRDVGTALVCIVSGVHLAPEGALAWILVVPTLYGTIAMFRERRFDLVALLVLPLAVAVALSFAQKYPIVCPGRWNLWLVPTSVLPIAYAFGYLARKGRGRAAPIFGAALATAFLVNQATSGAGVLHPDALRRADFRAGGDWPTTVATQEELARAVAGVVSAGEPLVGSGAEWRADAALRALGLTQYALGAGIERCGQWQTSVLNARECAEEVGRKTGHDKAWLLVAARRGESVRAVVADRCLGVLRSVRISDYLLVEVSLRDVVRRVDERRC